ncbi:hypothetical protein V493_06391 [Pseudogymnoascus sp. VKM F-4281 (FW-2241)]|nr:hypothetical protein V493_06391 [Pseudogymnoascus sp. VKM F-4281 (FW-2241)]
MISCLVPLPSTTDRRASRTLSIPDAPAIARAKTAAARRSASTSTTSPAALRSPESARKSSAGSTASPAASRKASAGPSGYSTRSGSSGAFATEDVEDEDPDMRRARMLLRCFDVRRKLAGEGGGAEVLEEARRLVGGVEERFGLRETK